MIIEKAFLNNYLYHTFLVPSSKVPVTGKPANCCNDLIPSLTELFEIMGLEELLEWNPYSSKYP